MKRGIKIDDEPGATNHQHQSTQHIMCIINCSYIGYITTTIAVVILAQKEY